MEQFTGRCGDGCDDLEFVVVVVASFFTCSCVPGPLSCHRPPSSMQCLSLSSCSLWSPAESTEPLIFLLANEQFTDCCRDSCDDLNL